MSDFIRTCQECGHGQKAKDPAFYAKGNDSWRNVKCRKCGSEALDYGSYKLESKTMAKLCEVIAGDVLQMDGVWWYCEELIADNEGTPIIRLKAFNADGQTLSERTIAKLLNGDKGQREVEIAPRTEQPAEELPTEMQELSQHVHESLSLPPSENAPNGNFYETLHNSLIWCISNGDITDQMTVGEAMQAIEAAARAV